MANASSTFERSAVSPDEWPGCSPVGALPAFLDDAFERPPGGESLPAGRSAREVQVPNRYAFVGDIAEEMRPDGHRDQEGGIRTRAGRQAVSRRAMRHAEFELVVEFNDEGDQRLGEQSA
jgi:hypothetical protein